MSESQAIKRLQISIRNLARYRINQNPEHPYRASKNRRMTSKQRRRDNRWLGIYEVAWSFNWRAAFRNAPICRVIPLP